MKTIALTGNPNVGKSTVFNELTGLRQHTGNWAGKTVEVARGEVTRFRETFRLVDLPGSYSLLARSAEEAVARDFICFSGADAAVVVCDATCLERNLNHVLQVIEACPRAVVCVNLMDEAKKKGVRIDLMRLEAMLGAPVCGCAARDRKGLEALLARVAETASGKSPLRNTPIRYPDAVERAIRRVEPYIEPFVAGMGLPARWVALRLLEGDESMCESIKQHLDLPLSGDLRYALDAARACLPCAARDLVIETLFAAAERICSACVYEPNATDARRLRTDRLLTGRLTGIPVMLLLLALVFYVTLSGANILSEALFSAFERVEGWLSALLSPAPFWLRGALVEGVFRVLAWVVSVMLPPMAIFFPLFTLLEDAGYLPRVAFTLDRRFQRCGACGKQALTMCMGLGCNAVGVTGCRIIDSPRERMIAMLTNSFMPCNGRFPTLILLLAVGLGGGALPAVALTGLIVLCVLATFAVSKLLSKTLLRGHASSFTLELPPYRRPQVGKVIVRSLLDRTLFVLGRAVAVAAPAGLLIWIAANTMIGGESVFSHITSFLDPFARVIGMDGVLLGAFILGFPANEIVLPIALMGYMAGGTLAALPANIGEVFAMNGWTGTTVACATVFTLMHWPCSTTCLTFRKETGSVKWTLLAMAIPTAIGVVLCALIALFT